MVNENVPITYVPILKWKRGEKMALHNIDPLWRPKLIPLLELVNDEGDTPDQLSKDIKKYWREPAYLDVHYRSKTFALNALSNLARYPGDADIIPVIRLDTPDILLQGILAVWAAYHNGIALRLIIDETTDFELLDTELELLLKRLSTERSSVDLIIDFGYITNATSYSSYITRVSALPKLNDWNRLIIAGGTFPSDLSEFTPNEDNFLARSEWLLFKEHSSKISRETIYSDYTVRHPTYYAARPLSGSISVRYTLEDKIQILRGKQNDKNFKYMVHSLNITSLYDSEFPLLFSWADKYIHEKAQTFLSALEDGIDPETHDFNPGGPADWVAVSVNHHMYVVLKRNVHS